MVTNSKMKDEKRDGQPLNANSSSSIKGDKRSSSVEVKSKKVLKVRRPKSGKSL